MKRVALSACLTMLAASLGAQVTPAPADSGSTACLVLNGIRIGADWGDSTRTSGARGDSSNRAGHFQVGGTTLDTTFTFDVAERSWTRSSLKAYVAGGVSGRSRNAATAADPRAGWHACVGITVGMEQPTLMLRGVRGQLHLKVDLTPLTRLPGATLDSLRQNQIRR
jgi:hypothetical protein